MTLRPHNSAPVTRALHRFARGAEGSISVEFVMWVPIFVAMLLLGADASLAYMRQSNLWYVSRETARIVSRHGFDKTAAEAYARSHSTFTGYTPDVEVTIENQAVTVKIEALSDQITPFGMLDFAIGESIEVSVTYMIEPT